MSRPAKMEGVFAFWRYDQYPYVLGGTVTRMDRQGNVETEEYGHGSFFKPVRLLPVDVGKEILRKLEELRSEYRGAQRALDEEFTSRAAALLTEVRG